MTVKSSDKTHSGKYNLVLETYSWRSGDEDTVLYKDYVTVNVDGIETAPELEPFIVEILKNFYKPPYLEPAPAVDYNFNSKSLV